MTGRIFVSSSRRYLVDEEGKPFFWLGDTAWELFHRLNREEAARYFETRSRQGFTVIQAVVLAEMNGLRVPSAYGYLPLHDEDPTRPNEAYFEYLDELIDLAGQHGLYIGLLPTWGDKVVSGMWGDGPVIFNPENAFHYGAYLGNRWRERRNILWILGGDRPPFYADRDYAPIWRAMAAGIQSATPHVKAFMTYHPRGGASSADDLHHEPWLDMNMMQSGHVLLDAPNWEMITADHRHLPPRPTLDGEPNYEDHPINPFTRRWLPEYGRYSDYDVRKQAYRSVFAGACGVTYGHHSVWQFYTPERVPINFPEPVWQAALERPGANQMIYLRRLLESRPYLTRIPDQRLLLSDADIISRSAHSCATRSSDGSYAMIYLPTSQPIEIEINRLSGEKLTAWWYHPRTGKALQIGEYARSDFPKLISPDDEGKHQDSVLVVDDAARDFPPPGQPRA